MLKTCERISELMLGRFFFKDSCATVISMNIKQISLSPQIMCNKIILKIPSNHR